MRLLFDENLSHRLVQDMADTYSGCVHVRYVGLRGEDDLRIRNYAAEQGFLLTSKDTDFYQRSIIFGAPPKVVWLRIGNAPTVAIGELLRQHHSTVRKFYEDSEATFLPLRSCQESG